MKAGIYGPPIWSEFLKEENMDPRTADSVQIFKGENRDPRTAESVRILKKGYKDQRTADSVQIFRGHAGIHGPPIWSEF